MSANDPERTSHLFAFTRAVGHGGSILGAGLGVLVPSATRQHAITFGLGVLDIIHSREGWGCEGSACEGEC